LHQTRTSRQEKKPWKKSCLFMWPIELQPLVSGTNRDPTLTFLVVFSVV